MFFNTISGGNGSTKEQAIIINAPSDKLGVDAEYKYLESIYGEQNVHWRLYEQNLFVKDNKYYDILVIELRNSQLLTFWFDINSFYGKE
jgi:hypothetical protein